MCDVDRGGFSKQHAVDILDRHWAHRQSTSGWPIESRESVFALWFYWFSKTSLPTHSPPASSSRLALSGLWVDADAAFSPVPTLIPPFLLRYRSCVRKKKTPARYAQAWCVYALYGHVRDSESPLSASRSRWRMLVSAWRHATATALPTTAALRFPQRAAHPLHLADLHLFTPHPTPYAGISTNAFWPPRRAALSAFTSASWLPHHAALSPPAPAHPPPP
ncbi:uncharacterized protein BXZ73DRAFT_105732 [Epithele typhae]|uniref:uncharacterized protein n=1 Tax=Epithele typhae TaxID=378194 RepID=UPI002007E4C6|nr:uncharacterized protein BXZ73DRAFT_105732 [Epithele typhae]KAH9916754.1 hypothetical protein BXZ73DRAFT_105732 [Epithele typhae]